MKRVQVRNDLLQQLQAHGKVGKHFEDLVNDYCSLWDVKTQLVKDIKTRGVMYKDYSSVGVEVMKNNPSTKELVMVNRQMLAILKDLGLNTAEVTEDDSEL